MTNRETFLHTFAHEVIGHHGLRNLFEKNGGYENYLINLLHNNVSIRKDIMSLSGRWKSYMENWNRNNIPGYMALVKAHSPTNDTLVQRRLLARKYMDSLPANQSVESEVLRNGIYYKEKVHIDVAVRLADEYMAELAGNYISDRNFVENMIGLGVPGSAISTRSKLTKERLAILNQVFL
jgi:hypothetical protein